MAIKVVVDGVWIGILCKTLKVEAFGEVCAGGLREYSKFERDQQLKSKNLF